MLSISDIKTATSALFPGFAPLPEPSFKLAISLSLLYSKQ
jgi:hypothetical protein